MNATLPTSTTRRRFIRRGCGAALALAAGTPIRRGAARQATPSPVAAGQAEIVVRPEERRQIIEGFGASGAWWAQEIGGWDEPNRQRIIELLFDRERGIGLSLYRYNIGAGSGKEIPDPWRRTETFEVAPGVYDWSKDHNAVWVLKAAHNAGVERFVAFANSPPARMTKSGTVSGGLLGGSNLKSDMYPAFARYLVDITRHLCETEGVPIGWISPINEPQWPWLQIQGQEGCHYSVDECVKMARTLRTAIHDSALDVRMSLPESGEWKGSEVYLDALLGKSGLAMPIDGFAIHDYHSTREDKEKIARYAAATYPETQLWMSEWTEMNGGRDTGMDSALTMADVITDDLTVGAVTSWQFWIAVSKYDYRDGLIYTEPGTQQITETKRLWTLGNFSRFIRPGAVRIEAEANGNVLRVSAFATEEQDGFVLVIVNPDSEAVNATLRFEGGTSPTVMTAYETSANHDLAPVSGRLPVGSVSFAARSVTTLVFVDP